MNTLYNIIMKKEKPLHINNYCKLPKVQKGNEIKIIKKCRDIHQMYIDSRKKNTEMQRWDKYWVEAYNLVMERLKQVV